MEEETVSVCTSGLLLAIGRFTEVCCIPLLAREQQQQIRQVTFFF
jgi:hypothetical protein